MAEDFENNPMIDAAAREFIRTWMDERCRYDGPLARSASRRLVALLIEHNVTNPIFVDGFAIMAGPDGRPQIEQCYVVPPGD